MGRWRDYRWLWRHFGWRRIVDQLVEVEAFDLRHGVDTARWVELGQFPPGIAGMRWSQEYQPAFTSVVARGLRAVAADLRARGEREHDYVCYDLGCGKGKVLWQALDLLAVREVVGVEHHPGLAMAARHNLRGHRRAADARVWIGDVREVPVWPARLIVFAFNPFDAPVLAAVEARLRSETEVAYLIYNNPAHDRCLGAWRRIADWPGRTPAWHTRIYRHQRQA